MTRADKISSRLPRFYDCDDPSSLISSIIGSVGKFMDEAQDDLVSIARSHWIDTSRNGDLDRLGAIFNAKRKKSADGVIESDPDYRKRLKMTILSYEGGGTLEAIQSRLSLILRLPEDYFSQENCPIRIVENPLEDRMITKKHELSYSKEMRWVVDAFSVQEAAANINLKVEAGASRIENPQIINCKTGESIKYEGEIGDGGILEIKSDEDGRANAFLNEKKVDVVSLPKSNKMPRLTPGKSEWMYSEIIRENQWVLDVSTLENAYLASDAVTTVTLSWKAHRPATIEIQLPQALLGKEDLKIEDLQDKIDSVKASGVIAKISTYK
jgi:hypothetical protein